jgi:hypothetical protein
MLSLFATEIDVGKRGESFHKVETPISKIINCERA